MSHPPGRPDPDHWLEELDALTAAPEHHLLLFENDFVRVIENIIPRGATVPLHTHRWPATLYLLSWSDILRRDAAGQILMDSRLLSRPLEGTVLWSPAIPPHTLENIGDRDFRLICVELKPQKHEAAGPGSIHAPSRQAPLPVSADEPRLIPGFQRDPDLN